MLENNKESKLLKDAIKEVFEHELLEKGMSKDRFDEVINDKNIFLINFVATTKKHIIFHQQAINE